MFRIIFKKYIFLLATNETAYINKYSKLKYPDLMVYNNYKHIGQLINNYNEIIQLPQTFTLKWKNIDMKSDGYKIKRLYEWLKLIIIS